MKFSLFLFLLISSAQAASPELKLKLNFDPDSGNYSKKISAKLSSFQPLEHFFIDNAADCFRGDIDGVKILVRKMAGDYNIREGGVGSFTVDSQTINGELSQLKITFHMKSGADWTWDKINKCK